jgi:hypothetical protein
LLDAGELVFPIVSIAVRCRILRSGRDAHPQTGRQEQD